MNPTDLPTFVEILHRHQVEFIIVGGAAIEAEIPSVSRDIDALVLSRDYARAARELGTDPKVVSISNEPGSLASGHFLSSGTLVRYELLDPTAYSGTRSGEMFFEFVRRYHGRTTKMGTVARPWVVWYMRLVIEDWRTYVEKILRDLRAGAPWGWIGKVRVVALKLGTADRIAPRIDELREVVRLAGLLPSD